MIIKSGDDQVYFQDEFNYMEVDKRNGRFVFELGNERNFVSLNMTQLKMLQELITDFIKDNEEKNT